MLYAIIATDVRDSQKLRQNTRPRHIEYLKRLVDAGNVVIAGPHPATDSSDPGPAGFTGSLIIAEFDSLEAAQAWAELDPYAQEGVFARVEVKPFIKVSL